MSELDAPTGLGVCALRERVAGGTLPAVEAVRACRERVARLDPTLNSFVRVDPEAGLQAPLDMLEALNGPRLIGDPAPGS